MRSLPLALLAILAGCLVGSAQVEERGAEKGGVPITFLPPPMHGQLSVGIYTKAGKLVRVLKWEATEKDFTVGLNGYITTWDGRDDAGAPAPAGTYFVRGYAVGGLDVDGVAYHGNDWFVDEDSPRIARIAKGGTFLPDGTLQITAELKNGTSEVLKVPLAGGAAASPQANTAPAGASEKIAALSTLPSGAEAVSADEPASLAFGSGKVWKRQDGQWRELPLKDVENPVHVAKAADSIWLIDATKDGVEVKHCSESGEILRLLPVTPGGPTPKWIAARGADQIMLWEEGKGVQRLRVLRREAESHSEAAGDRPVSTWQTVLSKSIRDSSTFAAIAPVLGRSAPFQPENKISVRLLPNPLLKDAPSSVSMEITSDKQGAYLRTADGLPLVRLTEATDLKWVIMGRENGSKALTIFQGDGTVVEEFRAGKLANMMAFDAGDYDWKGK